ncbi:MAG: hypothetical protein GY856_12035, partial [bacterium]|nr:hypothetical protein [bacterium]
LRTAIEALSRTRGTTLFMTVLAAFQALLHRYTGQRDLTIGTPVAGRTRPEVEDLIGVFINNLALRIELDGALEFQQLLERTRTVALQAFAHQELPFEKLVEALRPRRDLARAPLFQLMFILHNTPADAGTAPLAQLPEMILNALPIDPGTAIYDLTLTLYEPGDSLSSWFEYKTDLFEAATIARMEGHFCNLIRDAVAVPARRLAELALLAPPERHQLLAEWNDTGGDVPEASIHALIADQARRTPERVAVRRAGATLSYGELDRSSDRMAGRLARRGVAAESLRHLRPGAVAAAGDRSDGRAGPSRNRRRRRSAAPALGRGDGDASHPGDLAPAAGRGLAWRRGPRGALRRRGPEPAARGRAPGP